MNDSNITLVRSSFLRSRKEADQHKVAHLISGRQFLIDDETLEVLDYFKTPQDVNFTDLSTAMRSSLNYMMTTGMLIKESDAQETFYTKPSDHPFFGFSKYDATSDIPEIVLLGVPFGGGNPTASDTGKFPRYFRRFIHNHGLNFSNKRDINYRALGEPIVVRQLSQLIEQGKIKDAGDIFIHHYEARQDIYNKIRFLYEKIIKNNKVPFIIGGDHSISYPLIAGVASKYASFNVLHFDAHTDVYASSYEGILDKNGLHHHGNFVSKCLQLPTLKNYYQFGIRGINNFFHQDEKHPKLKTYWADELKTIIQNKEDIPLPNNENYYITFDIDVMDPSVAPGTATPVPNGFLIDEMLSLFNSLHLGQKKIIGIDFVEVNAQKDNENTTTALAVQIVLHLINLIRLDED